MTDTNIVYPYVPDVPPPQPAQTQPQQLQETRWHFGWNSCVLFMVNLVLFTLYAIMPLVSLPFILLLITLVAIMGIMSAMMSILFGKFWLSKVYATCGLIGNLCMPVWILLSLN